MLELVLANLRVRPLRTLISVVGVALGVILVVLFTGLARGMSNDLSKRASNWKAEIVFTRAGAMTMTSSNANVNTKYAERLLEIQGVAQAVPMYRYITAGEGRFGIKQIDGVDWPEFARMNQMQLVQGRAPTADDEAVIDEQEAESKKLAIGGTTELFGNRPFKVVGIFAPPSGARVKVSLAAMQNVLQAPNKCTYILVKIKDGENPQEVAKRIDAALPGNKLQFTADLIADAGQRYPELNTFLRALVALGGFVSTVFVLLSMYTTVTERRREIGVLKSLGASNFFIIGTIEREALMIGVLGTILGFIVSFAAAFAIQRFFKLVFEFGWSWTLTAIVIALGGSLIGALYPAFSAARLDPVTVLTNE